MTAETTDRVQDAQTPVRVYDRGELPAVRINGEAAARIFDGEHHGGLGASCFIVDVGPEGGPRRHRHPYPEIFVVMAGTVRVEAGGEIVTATPNEVAVVDAGVDHTFANVGPERALMVNVHVNGSVITEFSDDAPADPAVYQYEAP